MARRPTFFLSSTIYDFRDLRSAIKFSLEERGCRVLASEFNDFGISLDQHSYDACLSNIEQADYFVLLIGSRVGGWYDEAQRLSITQQEYRVAYELHKQRKLRLVSFVRSEVWQLKEDRKELALYLKKSGMADAEREVVSRSPSKFANDAEFVSNFILEVGRNVETGTAVRLGTPKPTGNWIHQFRDFREIHDVLATLAFTGLTAEEAAYRKALQHELLTIMSALLAKVDGTVIDLRPAIKRGLETQPITRAIRDAGRINVDLDKWNSFTTIFYQVMGLEFEPVVINDALTSTIFLEYDGEKGAFVQSSAYDALSRLWDELRRFRNIVTTDLFVFLGETSPRALGRRTGGYTLPAEKVGLLYSAAHRWINIVSLTEALILHLEGQPFQMPRLMPISPILDYEEAYHSERVSPAELRAHMGI